MLDTKRPFAHRPSTALHQRHKHVRFAFRLFAVWSVLFVVSKASSASASSETTSQDNTINVMGYHIHSDGSIHYHTDNVSNGTNNADVTNLPLGDKKISSTPQVGYVYSCMTQFNGRGAFQDGPWIHQDGTWDKTQKLQVQGAVSWPDASVQINTNGDMRVISSNGLPKHTTGVFPISSSDPAYQYDRNPNHISSQTVSLTIPMNPTVASAPNCVGGEVGVMLDGVPLYSAFDAEGRDAVAHEVQDSCDGHPQRGSQYHYHSVSNCLDTATTGHSDLLGYAFDGFGIYGIHGENGEVLHTSDLDECHGHTHEIDWNGQKVVMYHYHATNEFPYVVGCFKGTPTAHRASNAMGEGGPGGPGGQGQGQGGPGQGGPDQGGPGGPMGPDQPGGAGRPPRPPRP